MNQEKYGVELLRNPELNKSTSFSKIEREKLKLNGLLPYAEESMAVKLQRVMLQLGHQSTNLEKYIYLMGLLDREEKLFYATVMSDPTRFLPIIYDPTIGEACLKFGHIYRNPNGLYISLTDKGKIKEILRNWPKQDIRVICVTNGGRILGLGDLGVNGMPIPIGKLQLYTAAAGVPPASLLPIMFDVGTNNMALLADPLYLGIKQTRPSINELYELTDEFVDAVQEVFPQCCIHFEDWTGTDAVHLLARYRNRISCYNDDIQGTAAITLSGMINACKIKKTSLRNERFLFLGAGSAAIGLSNLLVTALTQEGVTLEEARARIYMFDELGLIEASRVDLADFQKPYAHNIAPMQRNEFVQGIKLLKPTALIGVSTCGGAFTEEVVKTMSEINQKPVILALSNPTEHAECTAEQAYNWSDGNALYAAGVQFPPVSYRNRILLPGQANNFYIFPAIGMAIFAANPCRITDEMFIEAAHAVANQVPNEHLECGLLYPLQANILEIEIKTAARIVNVMFANNLARVDKPQEDYEAFIKKHIYRVFSDKDGNENV